MSGFKSFYYENLVYVIVSLRFQLSSLYHVTYEHLKMYGDSGPCSPADIDECESMVSGCQHSCTNTAGSYECMCDRGYSLSTDGHSCEGIL